MHPPRGPEKLILRTTDQSLSKINWKFIKIKKKSHFLLYVTVLSLPFNSWGGPSKYQLVSLVSEACSTLLRERSGGNICYCMGVSGGFLIGRYLIDGWSK